MSEKPQPQIVGWESEPPALSRRKGGMFDEVLADVRENPSDKYAVIDVPGRKVSTYVQSLRKANPDLEIVNTGGKLYVRVRQ